MAATALPSADSAALANDTLLRVLARMASPLRHDLAGGLLVPQMQLQMLRRKLGKPGAEVAVALGAIDDILLRLQDMRALHETVAAWLSLRDTRELALDDAVVKAAADFALPFADRNSELVCAELPAQRYLPAQPTLLLVHAVFCAVADDPAGHAAVVTVRGGDTAGTAWVEWQCRPRADAEALPPREEADAVSSAGLVALCARFGARAQVQSACWRLQLDLPQRPSAPADRP